MSNPHDSTVCVQLSNTNYVPDAFQRKSFTKTDRVCFAQLDERSANEALRRSTQRARPDKIELSATQRERERELVEGGLRRRMRARSVQLKSVRAINNIGAFAQAGKTKRRTDSGDKRRIKKIQPAAATPIEALLSLPLSVSLSATFHLPQA